MQRLKTQNLEEFGKPGLGKEWSRDNSQLFSFKIAFIAGYPLFSIHF